VKKYPHGRVILYSGKTIFEDRANKFPGIPYIEWYNYRITGKLYGMSELTQLAPIQKQYNARANQTMDILNFAIGPIRFYDRRSGLDPSTLTNSPNQWIPVHSVDGIRTEQGYRIGGAPFEAMENEKRNMETVSGVREITQGTVPSDVRSGAAIEALQEAADVRLRGKSGELETTTYNAGRFIIDMIVQFYKEDIHYNISDELAQSKEYKLWKDKKLTSDFFDIEVRAGVNQPRSRIAQQQFMQWGYDRDIFDELYIINHSQIDDKETLIARQQPLWDARKEAKKAEAEGAAQQAAQPQGGAESAG
jgi:hypothetical protein